MTRRYKLLTWATMFLALVLVPLACERWVAR